MVTTFGKALVFIAALTLTVGLLAAIHLYFVDRLLIDTGWSEPALAPAWIAAGIGAMIAALLAERFVAPPNCRLIALPGYTWMGFALMLLVTLGASDLLLLLTGLLDDGDVAVASARAYAVLSLSACATAIGMRSALAQPPLTRITLTLERWPQALDGLRIVQLSDLHIGPILDADWAERLTARANALEPDLIVVTGDLIDGFAERVGPQTLPLRQLEAPLGVFAITGNHEMFNGIRAWIEHHRDVLGLRLLANERVTLESRGARFDLVGTHDRTGFAFGHPEDIDAALEGRDDERPVIWLAHDPLSFKKAPERGIDLTLSGHTHGGQIWPLHAFVRLVIPFVSGHHRRGESQLYVSRGCGFWGPPLRLAAPSELTEITLRAL